MQRKIFTKEQAYQKLKHYCAYQERCHADVKEKAYSLGLKKTEVEELTTKLIEENCLNEERFAKLFAGGKSRINQWGRMKIKFELNKKRVSGYSINKALDEIDAKKYSETLQKLAQKKWNSFKGTGMNQFIKMTKTKNFLLQKGYEPVLIFSEIKKLQDKTKGAD
jgi:regulatory protein